ncbi:MAG: choice-of-anchor P family protein [Gammaproteobacteria bacterium]
MHKTKAFCKMVKAAATSCALLTLATAPTFATGTISTGKVSGEAYSVEVDLGVDIGDLLGLTDYLHLNNLLGLVGNDISIQVGPVPHVQLPPYGGFDSETLATINLLDIVNSETLANVTAGGVGSNKAGAASASVVENLNLLGLIQAEVLGSYCSSYSNGAIAGSNARTSLVGLVIGGKRISVSTPPNTTVNLYGKGLLGLPVKVGKVVINEQILSGDGHKTSSITSNALHVSITNPEILSLLVGDILSGDIVVSSAHCDVDVKGQNGDEPPADAGGFVTGGGRIDIPGGFATFGFNARDGKVQLQFIDHETGMKVHADTVSNLAISGNCATLSGSVEIDGVADNYFIEVCDNGEPGIGIDTFSIDLGNGYHSDGTLTGGNIQLH